MNRTPAYWPARILLAVGIASTVAIVIGVVFMPTFRDPCLGCDDRTAFGLPMAVYAAAVAVAVPLIGLGLMIRLFRGPRDEPPAWRHRDRD